MITLAASFVFKRVQLHPENQVAFSYLVSYYNTSFDVPFLHQNLLSIKRELLNIKTNK